MSFLKSIIKQNAVYQSNFQMSRQCLQRSDVFHLTLQRFTVSTYIGDGLQSEDFQTFWSVMLVSVELGSCASVQNDILMRASFWQNFSLLTPLCQKLKKRTLDGAKGTRVYIYIFIKISSREVIFNELMVSFFCSFFFYQYILATAVI